MTNCDIEAPNKDSGSADEGSPSKLSAQKFYSPLSVTGYLTPLQRKKLRERRNNTSVDLNDARPKEVKAHTVKRKKRTESFVHDKKQEQIKRMKTKDSTQQVQYSVSKIVHKTMNDSSKPKKFFKSSSSDRLDKANFTMPLVLKRNAFSAINKTAKETIAHSWKLTKFKESNSCEHLLSEVFGSTKDIKSNNIYMKENLHENTISNIQVSENSENLRQSHTFAPKQNNLEQISLPGEEKLTFEFNWPSDEEFLKRRERARELARKKNVLKETNAVPEIKVQDAKDSQVKLYPIFQIAMKKQSRSNDMKRNLKNLNKKIKTSSNCSDQMIIDAGQREIGAKICSICNMIYTIGQEEDERLHLNYHNMHVINLKFLGWKEENVIGEYSDGRVIMIRKQDKSFKLKKVEDVLEIANRDLGFQSPAMPVKPDLTFLLFISKEKTVAGCVVAEPITKAFQVVLASNFTDASQEKSDRLSNWCSTSKAVPAICGVNRIWVAHNFRRHKVASRMVDCLRCHFIYGHVIGIREIAFTDPSPDGQNFAASYTGTPNFLVYK